MSTLAWVGIIAAAYFLVATIWDTACRLTEAERERNKQLNRELRWAVQEEEERDPDWAVMGGYAGLYSQEEDKK